MIVGTVKKVSEQAVKPSWPILAPEAFHGQAGAFVKDIAPYSEADPVGILLHTLTMCGAYIGSGPHALVEHLPHPPRINFLQVGRTGAGRKGTAATHPRFIFNKIDPEWTRTRIKTGLTSGEGLTYLVRDELKEEKPVKKQGRHTGEFETIVTDRGEPDKRLLIVESEFAGALKVMEREGNTLSARIRDAWDHGTLTPQTKTDRCFATNAHIAIIGHITVDELRRYLTLTERGNGFANRFLFALTKRQQFLPDGAGAPRELLEGHAKLFAKILEAARRRGCVTRDPQCAELWREAYPRLEEELPGLTGAILGRGAAQVLRLSLLYALLDPEGCESSTFFIRIPHLLAALAIWDYCRASVLEIFGESLGDPTADRIFRAIKTQPQTDTDLYELLGKHGKSAARKDQALDLLERLNRVHAVKVPTVGRSIREWHVGPLEGCAICAKRG